MPELTEKEPRLSICIKERGVADGFRYVFPEDGHRIFDNGYRGWLEQIHNHYQRNGYPMPDDWVEIAEHQLCLMLPPGTCAYPDGSDDRFHVKRHLDFNDVVNGTKVLAAWAASGFPLVSKEVALERVRTCIACYANVDITGCLSCSHIMERALEIIGDRRFEDAIMARLEGKSCAYCHCLTLANVWVPVEVSRHGVGAAELEAMSTNVPHCWKAKSIKALNADG